MSPNDAFTSSDEPGGKEQGLFAHMKSLLGKDPDPSPEVEQAKADAEKSKALFDEQIALRKAYYDATFEVAKGAIERSRAAAELVQKASSAIVVIYSAVLGFVFSAQGNPLPWRGLLSVFFLGLAVWLSTMARTFLPHGELPTFDKDLEPHYPLRRLDQAPPVDFGGDSLANNFLRWSRGVSQRGSAWLRASVIALGVALVFMPIAFINLAGGPAAEKPAWPTLDANAPANIELQKIVYSAQVAEVAQQRTAHDENGSRDWIWLIVGGVLTVAVVLAAEPWAKPADTGLSTSSAGPPASSPPPKKGV